jgi:uncharacterized protein involved in exopolysaccharide biosynthesis
MLARASPADEPEETLPPRIGPAALIALARARIAAVVAIVALVTAAAFLYSQFVLARSPTFKAAATLDIQPSAAQIEFGTAFARGNALQSAGLLTQTYAEYATSRPVLEAIAERYLARNPEALQQRSGGLGIRKTLRILDEGGPAVRDPRLLFIDNLRKSLDVATVDGTHLLRIEVEWGDPLTAATIANEVADRLIAEAAERATGPTAQLNRTLGERLEQARTLLNQRQVEAAQTRASLGVADIQRQKEALIGEKLAEESRLTNERAQIASSATQVGSLQRQSDGLLSSATPAIEQALALERPRLAGLQQSIRQRAARVGQLNSQLGRLADSESRLSVLDREIETLKGEVAALTERYNNVSLENLAGAPPIRVVEQASPPLARASPRVLANTFMGFMAGCALAGLFLLLAPRPRSGAAAVFAEPVEPAPLPFAGRTYDGILRRPAGRRSFSAEESRDIAARLDELLAQPLADPRRVLYVIAEDTDGDAIAVFNLLSAFLKSRGEAVNVEADVDEGGQLVRVRSRELIYCGGLSESGAIPPPARPDEDMVLVVGEKARPRALGALQDRFEDAGWPRPYLIRLGR